MLREYRVVVVQRQSNDPQVATKGHGEEDKSFTQSMFKVPSTPRAAPVVDVNWMGSQVKEHHHQSHRQIVKTTAAASTTKTCEVRNTSSANRHAKEQLNVHQGSNFPSTNPFHQDLLLDENDSSLDLETMHLMLEPNMRPVTPDPSSRISLEIFKEHKQLAQEFLKVQTEIAYVSQHREELLSKMDPETRRQKLDLCSKLEERDALLKLEANLRKQLELINQSKTPEQAQSQPHFQQFPVQQNRLQTSRMRNDDTLTNQWPANARPFASAIPSDTSSVSSSGEAADNWVFLDSAKL